MFVLCFYLSYIFGYLKFQKSRAPRNRKLGITGVFKTSTSWHTYCAPFILIIKYYLKYLQYNIPNNLLWYFQLLVRKIRRRLALIYRALGDEDQYNTHIRLANQTDSALGLNCGACGEVFGLEPDSLEALPCAHILHAR